MKYWEDKCCHHKEDDVYIGSFKDNEGKEYDIYLHDRGNYEEDNKGVCIRYGNGDNEYRSLDIKWLRDIVKREEINLVKDTFASKALEMIKNWEGYIKYKEK